MGIHDAISSLIIECFFDIKQYIITIPASYNGRDDEEEKKNEKDDNVRNKMKGKAVTKCIMMIPLSASTSIFECIRNEDYSLISVHRYLS
jgi:hypothetical protein